MESQSYFLGVDAGTTNMKAVLIDLNLNVIDTVSLPLKIYIPFEGASEMDMNENWDAFCIVIQELRKRNENIWNDIKGIAVTGQGDGLWPLDKEGKPICRAMTWQDTRSKDIGSLNTAGLEDINKDEYANPVFYGSRIPLLKWLKVNQPNIYKKIEHPLHCVNWLNYKLTGVICTDVSDCITEAFNIITKQYINKVFEIFDISDMLKKYPTMYESTHIAGSVQTEAAKQTGLNEGCPVLVGMLDGVAVQVGGNMIEAGKGYVAIGTTMVAAIKLNKAKIDIERRNGWLWPDTEKDKYTLTMGVAGGGGTISYLKELLFPGQSFEEIMPYVEKIPAGSEGLIYHPYIYGERAPFVNPLATAGFFGLTANHTRYHMMRAGFESLGLSAYHCFSHYPDWPQEIQLYSGGAKNELLCQIICDVLAVPGEQIIIENQGAVGCVRTLLIALGYVKDYSELKQHRSKRFEPDMQRHKLYIDLYEQYTNLRTAMVPFWEARKKLT